MEPFETQSFDLILMDLRIPDGYQVFLPGTIRNDLFFEELADGHPVHVVEVRTGRTTRGFVCLTLEGDTTIEFKTVRALSNLLFLARR
jgi:hypothetical protein